LLATNAEYREVLAAWAASTEDDDLMANESDDTDVDDPLAASVVDHHDPANVSAEAIRNTYAVLADDIDIESQMHEPIGGD
jgi:hypothetical protein